MLKEPDVCRLMNNQGKLHLDELLKQFDADGFEAPTRSMYFVWVDRYIIDTRDVTKDSMQRLAKGMVDGRFIHACHVFDVDDDNYLLVCRFSLAIYDIVFVLPSRTGYLAGLKYFMRIKGKIDLVSLRQLFKTFRIGISSR